MNYLIIYIIITLTDVLVKIYFRFNKTYYLFTKHIYHAALFICFNVLLII